MPSLDYLLLLPILLVGCTYAIQLSSPLRLNTDAVEFLSLADSISTRGEFTYHGQASHYPPGYPLALVIMIQLGYGSSAMFIGFNLLLLSVGVAALYTILVQYTSVNRALALLVCLLTSMSYITAKHSLLPVSDIPFFGLTMLSLLGVSYSIKCTARGRYFYLVASALCIMIAVMTRTAGIVLMPLLVWSIALRGSFDRVLFRWNQTSNMLKCSIVLGTSISVSLLLVTGQRYISSAVSVYAQSSLPTKIIWIAGQRASEIGELVINVPQSKLPATAALPMAVLGALSLLLIAREVWRRRDDMSLLGLFTVLYLAMLLLWPYTDARFLLPVLPMLLVYFMLGLLDLSSRLVLRKMYVGSLVPVMFVAWFIITGIVAIAYNVRISMASDGSFPQLYGDGSLTATYDLALNGTDPADGTGLNADALHLLRRFELRAK